MGVVLAVFSFLFLLAGVTTQIVSYLTSYMYENTLIARDHNGLFYRCGDLYGVIIGCYWWNRDIFNKDPSNNRNLINVILYFYFKTLYLSHYFKNRMVTSSYDFINCIWWYHIFNCFIWTCNIDTTLYNTSFTRVCWCIGNV